MTGKTTQIKHKQMSRKFNKAGRTTPHKVNTNKNTTRKGKERNTSSTITGNKKE